MRVRVAELVAPRRFDIREEDLDISKEQVLVKVAACGICYGDLTRWQGKKERIKFDIYQGYTTERLGHEPAGVVERAGREVKNFKEGDRVTGLFMETYATHAVASPECLIKIPDGVPTEHAIAEPLKCCVTSIRAGQPEWGDYVALVGCGQMGLIVLAGLARCPVAEIIAIDPIDSRLTLAKELGATVVINPTKSDAEGIINRVTKGRGVDVAFEATGVPGGLESASKILRDGRARLILVGFHYARAEYNLSYWVKCPVIHSTQPKYSLDAMDDLRRAIIGLEKGIFPMEKIITHKFKLEEINKAFETMESKAEGYIKGIIVPSD